MDNLSHTPNKELMARARKALTGNWAVAIGAMAIYWVGGVVLSYPNNSMGVVSMIYNGALAIGLAAVALSLARGLPTKVSDIFNDRFLVSIGAYFLQMIFVFLWLILLIIPGIIAAYSYTLTFYLLKDDKDLEILEAIQKSKELMRGNKWKYACLQGRFIGWAILCLFTGGIGFLWLVPYMVVSTAEFYEDVVKTHTVPNIDATNPI